jgi:hypothetical protein
MMTYQSPFFLFSSITPTPHPVREKGDIKKNCPAYLLLLKKNAGRFFGLLNLLRVSLLFACITSSLTADELSDMNEDTERLWRRGVAAEDGAFTASANSMIAWGIGIGVAAAVLAIVIEGNDGSSYSH